jgi:condensin-2 complex subunit G2
VRVRAAQALQHVFPLGDAKALPKATLALIQLLQDQHARVRIAGATTTVAALVLYWEAMPSSDIRQLLLLLQEHGRDTTSSAVRVSALHSIATLLDSQPASHAVLRTLLPTFGNLLHDTCERVRCATVHLLKTIKSIPGIKYYHVVPVSHLLARLVEDDDTKVATAITELVQNSYLPSSKTGQEQVQRLLHLVTNSFPAAKVFCAHLKLPTNAKAKLCVMLYKVLEHEGETKTKKHYGSKPQEPSLVVQVAEIIGILYQSVSQQVCACTWIIIFCSQQ